MSTEVANGEEAAGGAWRNVARASARLEDRFMPGPLDQVPRFFAALFRPGISVTARLAPSLPRRHGPRSGSASARRWAPQRGRSSLAAAPSRGGGFVASL